MHSGGSPAVERGSVAALVANAVDAMHRSSTPDPSTARRQRSSDSSDPGTPSDGAVAPISGASSRRSSDAEDDPDGDDGDDGYSSDSNEDEEDDDDEDGAAKTEVDEEDDDDLESGAQQGDDEDTLDDFVNRGGARASGGGTSRKDGADTTSDADNNDGIGDDGGVDDELDRPRVPTHFTARDLMAQGRALCHVLVRLCNLQASGTHKLHLQRMVVPGGPSGLPAGSPPQHRAQSRLLMAAAGELLASPITPKPGSTFGTSGGAVAGDGTRAPAASPRSPSEASGGEGGVIGAVVGGELLADVEVELDDTQLADSAAEEDLLMEVMAQVNVSESEEDSEGSESDPSGDNLDEAALKRTSTFKKLIGEPKKTKKKRRKARKGGRRTRPWLSKKTGTWLCATTDARCRVLLTRARHSSPLSHVQARRRAPSQKLPRPATMTQPPTRPLAGPPVAA